MNKNEFTASDSFKTIENAINDVKAHKTGASFYYVSWGLILFIYFFIQAWIASKPELKGTIIDNFSWVLFPIGGLISYLNKNKDQKEETYVPFLEKVYFFAFTGLACIYGVMTFASTCFSSNLVIILFPLMIGSTVYIVGGITKHKISIIGGIVGMLLSIISILSSPEIQYLMAALACISACIIPGITMRKGNV